MLRTNWITQKIHSNTHLHLKRVTSLTLINTGNTPLVFREQTLAPEQIFVLEGDGSYSDIELEIRFETGSGQAILNYRSVLNC